MDVAVVLGDNDPVGTSVGAVAFDVTDSDTARLRPFGGSGDYLNSNPDFNESVSSGWRCAMPPPLPDTGAAAPDQAVSRIDCQQDHEERDTDPVTVSPGSPIRLAVVHYVVPPGAPLGVVDLAPAQARLLDGALAEFASCAPAGAQPAVCLPVRITLVASVGGVAEPVEPAAPAKAQATSRHGEDRSTYVAIGAILALGIAATGGWALRRRWGARE